MPDRAPLFSICIPNYNYARYIDQTIEIILEQDCQDFEIIVADNASTDGSVAVVERYARASGKIRLIKNRHNIGFAPNLERAARPAQGQFMLMLSSDDVMLPGALGTYRQVLEALGERAPRAVIASAMAVIDSEGRRYDRTGVPSWYPLQPAGGRLGHLSCKQIAGKDMLTQALRWLNNPLPFASTMYSRELYAAVEGYNGTWTVSPDYHFVIKLLGQNPTVVYLDEEWFGYRVHAANQTAEKARQKSLKAQFDYYQLCLDNQQVAAEFGVSSEEMIRVLIDGVCLKKGGGHLSRGDWMFAFRLFCLAWALYPKTALKSLRTYGLAALLLLGPLGGALVRLAIRVRGDRSGEPRLR